MCSASQLDQDTIEAIDQIEDIGIELGHTFLQKPGMLTFLNNHVVYHGRTAWKHDDDASSRDGTSNGRLLLRAWISPFNSRELPGDGPYGEAYKTMWGDTKSGAARGGLEPAIKAGLKTKPKELIEAYATGKAQYYGLYKRSFEGEDVHFDEKRSKAGEGSSSSSEPSNSGSASPK